MNINPLQTLNKKVFKKFALSLILLTRIHRKCKEFFQKTGLERLKLIILEEL